MKSSADLSSPRIAWDHFADPESGLSAKKKLQLRILVFVAHPDDETIGASSLMSRVADVSVIFLTDGAPHDPCFWSPDAKGTREDYANMRWNEAKAAMALMNISPERILCLGGVDQDAIHGLPVLVPRFVELLREQQPDIVVTHPYEGGPVCHGRVSRYEWHCSSRTCCRAFTRGAGDQEENDRVLPLSAFGSGSVPSECRALPACA